MLSDMKPFKIFGNVYFVGCLKYSCHIIDTGEGLIMLDNGYEAQGPAIMESMEMLGLHPEDIRKIVITHGHADHFEATPQFLERCHAETYLSELDSHRGNLNFTPDVLLYDGDTIELGNTKIDVVWTPGHTVGTMSFFFDAYENGRTVRAGMFGGTGMKQVTYQYLKDRGLYLTQRDYFYRSVKKLHQYDVELFLGNHCDNNDTLGKYEKLAAGAAENPFLDPAGWHKLLDDRKRELDELLAKEKAEGLI